VSVEATPRKAMTKPRRLRIYLACNGRCVCGVKVPMAGTVIDHRIPLWMGGADDDANLRFLCPACDKPKTAKDKGAIGKVKRLIAREDGTRRPRKPIASKGFDKTRTRRFDGSVVPRGEVRG
jgi:5-methylcytosine-specific restriction protein A